MSEFQPVIITEPPTDRILAHPTTDTMVYSYNTPDWYAAAMNPTTPAQRAAVAVLAGDTRPEVLAPILDELAERFAGGPKVEPWRVWTNERPTVPGWHWWLLPGRVPWAVYLQQGDQGLWFRLSAAEPRVFLTDTEDGCLWAGPIPHPAKPTA